MSYGIGGSGSVPEAGTFVAPVAGTRIFLRRSDTQGKKPSVGDAEYGELFVNYHSSDPLLCFKDNADNIVEIKPQDPVGSGPTPPTTGNETGDLWWDGTHLLVWNGSAWVIAGAQELSDLSDVDTTGVALNNLLAYDGSKFVPVAPASISVDVDLEYSKQTDKGIILNSAGDDATITAADTIYAGLMLPADKIKLDGIEDGAEANVGTNLTFVQDKLFGTVESSTGTGATIPLGNGINAGLSQNDFTDDDHAKLDGIADGAIASVDLGYTAAPGGGTVTNDAGSDASIPLADGTNAGLTLHNFSQADKDKLDGIEPGSEPGTVTSVASGDGLTGGPITDAGTLSVQADGDTITVSAAGIKVTDGKFVTPGDQTTALDDYLPLAGGNLTGGVTQQVRAISPSKWDLEESNLWEVGGIDIPNPTNMVAGMTGAIVIMAAPTSWGGFCKFPDGTPVAPSATPAVVPYYVRSTSEILIGSAVEGIV
jgi:hypothetical protein